MPRRGGGSSQVFAIPADAGIDPSARPLLQASDFTYLGYYALPPYPASFPNGTENLSVLAIYGLTYRYVGGQLRFLSWFDNGAGDYRLAEYAAPANDWNPANNAASISSLTTSWNSITNGVFQDAGHTLPFQNGELNHYGVMWDSVNSRFFLHTGELYTTDATLTHNVMVSYPGAGTGLQGGNVSSTKGPWAPNAGWGTRMSYGGTLTTPAWWQTKYGAYPYVVGFGGTASVVSNGVSAGPALVAIPEPGSAAQYTNLAGVDLVRFDSGASLPQDWYTPGNPSYNPGSLPTSFERGPRPGTTPTYREYFDNSTVSPPTPPVNGYWDYVAPDGYFRWNWGLDYIFGAAFWIDGPSKNGVGVIASLGKGDCVYTQPGNQPTDSGRIYDLQLFDPNNLGKAINGSIKTFVNYPYAHVNLTNADMTAQGMFIATAAQQTSGSFRGTCYDPATKILYALGLGTNANPCIYLWRVNA